MDQQFVCTRCDEKFVSGAWFGCRGNKTLKHIAEPRTFYSESDSLLVNSIPSRTIFGDGGQRIEVVGKMSKFIGGTFTTTDPEEQEVLAKRCTMTTEQYQEMRLTDQQKNARLRTANERLVQETHDLKSQLEAALAAKKASKDGGGVAVADEPPTPGKRSRKSADEN